MKKSKTPPKDEPTEADKASNHNKKVEPRRSVPPPSGGLKPFDDKCVANAISETNAAALIDELTIHDVSEGDSSNASREDKGDDESKQDLIKLMKGVRLHA